MLVSKGILLTIFNSSCLLLSISAILASNSCSLVVAGLVVVVGVPSTSSTAFTNSGLLPSALALW